MEGLGAGADDYLIQPFSARELMARVDTHIKLAEVRRQAAALVRESDLRSRKLFEANIFGVAFGDLNGRVLDTNRAYLDLLGYTREDLDRGEISWDRLTPPEQRELDSRAQLELRQRGTLHPVRKRLHPQGRIARDGPHRRRAPARALRYSEQLRRLLSRPDGAQKIESQLRHTQKLESLGVLAGPSYSSSS